MGSGATLTVSDTSSRTVATVGLFVKS